MSRRKAGEAIKNLKIKVNDSVVSEPWTEINPETDRVYLDGQLLNAAKINVVVYAVNKPSGFITAMSDYRGRKTVKDLVDGRITENIFHVGRLDKDTSGLLLLTNDGDLANKLTHPSSNITKTYLATIKGMLSPGEIASLETGVTLRDGFKTAGARLKILRATNNQSVVKLIISEGHKREVREMFLAIGKQVIELKRVAIGKLTVHVVPKSGDIKLLSGEEIAKLNEKGAL